jgi:hypothetical protein
MKNRQLFISVTAVALIVVIVGSAVAALFLSDDETPTSSSTSVTTTVTQNECSYTEEEKDRVYALYAREIDEEPQSVDSEAIAALKGECELDALEQAYELGGRVLRDFTECWPECAATLDYSEQRISFAVEDGRMIYIANG